MNEKAVSRYGPPNLPSKNVQCVFQDSEAWLWFGTDKGLARFNGSDFKSSATPGSGLDQFAGEDVRSIAEDQSGAMWLASATGVRRITKHGVSLEPALAGYDARRISVDAQGVVWIAMAEGLFKFDGSASLLTRSQGLPSNDVRSAVADKDGRVWIATAAGVVILEGNKVRPPDQREGSPAHSPQPVGSTTPASPP